MTIIFETRYNGGRPYQVEFHMSHNHVLVHGQDVTLKLPFLDIYVGITNCEYMLEHGGSCMLLRISTTHYAFIGHEIWVFEPKKPIHIFVAEMGNSGVPYPYAIDELNNYYLFAEEVVLLSLEQDEKNPYNYYYRLWEANNFQEWKNNKDVECLKYENINLKPIDDCVRVMKCININQIYQHERSLKNNHGHITTTIYPEYSPDDDAKHN